MRQRSVDVRGAVEARDLPAEGQEDEEEQADTRPRAAPQWYVSGQAVLKRLNALEDL